MRVLSIKPEIVVGQVTANYQRAFSLLEQGASLYHPDVILLPEGFAVYNNTPDPTWPEQVAEPVPGPTGEAFCACSRRYGAMILFGLVRRNPAGAGLYNSILVIDDGKIVGIYDKTHLCMDHRPETCAYKNEQALFLPGDHLGLFDTRFGRIGVQICHDGEYPEMWRVLALEGAQAIFWPMNCGDMSVWAKLHARWNAVPVFTSNVVTRNAQGQRRGGGSICVDVHGEPFDAAGTAESFVFADVDLAGQAAFRAAGVTPQANVFRVRRADLYGSLTRRGGA